jgi:uncharacterized phage infection (PIP) family protein YhgE
MWGVKASLGYMDIKQLDQEKFNTLKELTEIHASISSGKVELIKLKSTTDEYMKLREVEAEERVIKVLKESRTALEETSQNHQELSAYGTELQAYANELKSISLDITDLFKDFNKRMKDAEVSLDTNHKQVTEVLKNIKVERVQVQEDRKMLERERKETYDGTRLLKDRRDALERAWAELDKKLKDNI